MNTANDVLMTKREQIATHLMAAFVTGSIAREEVWTAENAAHGAIDCTDILIQKLNETEPA